MTSSPVDKYAQALIEGKGDPDIIIDTVAKNANVTQRCVRRWIRRNRDRVDKKIRYDKLWRYKIK